jgi:hypothetical protein
VTPTGLRRQIHPNSASLQNAGYLQELDSASAINTAAADFTPTDLFVERAVVGGEIAKVIRGHDPNPA